MIHGNLGVALTQLGEGDEAVAAHAAGLRIAEARGMVDAADQARSHLLKARVPHCDWVARDAMLAEILYVDRRRMDRGERPALLPFDTLLVDMPPRARMRHAVYTSRALEHYGDLLPPPAPNAPNGSLRDAETTEDPVFGLAIPKECPGVPSEILQPRNTWSDGAAYDAKAKKLAGLFRENFKTYEAGANPEIVAAGPKG